MCRVLDKRTKTGVLVMDSITILLLTVNVWVPVCFFFTLSVDVAVITVSTLFFPAACSCPCLGMCINSSYFGNGDWECDKCSCILVSNRGMSYRQRGIMPVRVTGFLLVSARLKGPFSLVITRLIQLCDGGQ